VIMQALLIFLALVGINAFSFVPWSGMVRRIQQDSPVIAREMQQTQRTALYGKKPDLFSDDLFADDDKDDSAERRNYLDEAWDVNPEDRDALRSFSKRGKATEQKGALVKERKSTNPTNDAVIDALEKKGLDLERENDFDVDLDTDEEVPAYPVFVLNYLFKDEYAKTNIGTSLTEHENYAQDFKRIINSDQVNLMLSGATKQTRGMSIIFAGLSDEPTEKEETFQDILKFIKDDPLILQDIVEQWDVLDMDPGEDEDKGEVDPEKERIQDLYFQDIVGMKKLSDAEQKELDEARIRHPDWFFEGAAQSE
jgi:hypothetical protein